MSCNRCPATDLQQQMFCNRNWARRGRIFYYIAIMECVMFCFLVVQVLPGESMTFVQFFTRRNVIFYYISTMKCVIFCFMVFQVSPKEASFLFNFSLDEESFLLYFKYGLCPFLFPGGSSSSQKKHRFYSTFY